jgi:hypothetical protein
VSAPAVKALAKKARGALEDLLEIVDPEWTHEPALTKAIDRCLQLEESSQ